MWFKSNCWMCGIRVFVGLNGSYAQLYRWYEGRYQQNSQIFWYLLARMSGLHFFHKWNNTDPISPIKNTASLPNLKSSSFSSFSRSQAPSRFRRPQWTLTIPYSYFLRPGACWGKNKFEKNKKCSSKGKWPAKTCKSQLLLLIGAFDFFDSEHTVMAAAANIGAKCSCCDMPTHEQLNSPTT